MPEMQIDEVGSDVDVSEVVATPRTLFSTAGSTALPSASNSVCTLATETGPGRTRHPTCEQIERSRDVLPPAAIAEYRKALEAYERLLPVAR